MTWLVLIRKGGPYLAVLAIVAGIAFGGWYGRGLYEDSQELSELKGAQKAIKAATDRESNIAKLVERKLSTLTANQTVIDRGVIREIQKPVYRNVCLPADGLSLLRAAARGEAVSLPAEPAEEMPGNAARAD